jgi:2-phosphosulfolactate phosphatase
VAVVIDVLRATSTMIQALATGAECVVPCGEIDEARQIAGEALAGTIVLGGERGGLKIPGFDLGNSPDEYSSSRVGGRQVAFTTTNGTRALIRAGQARRILVAALANVTAVAEVLRAESGAVHIVCAGTDGSITAEDVLCAGGIAQRLIESCGDFDWRDDSTQLAVNLYQSCGRDYDRTLQLLRSSRGGRNLIDCGLGADIDWCAKEDRFDIVPELFVADWQVRVVSLESCAKQGGLCPP